MLKNFIINLKNVIFFKLVMYFLAITMLVFLLQIFNKDYSSSVNKRYGIEESLAQETLRLYSIKNSEETILNTYLKYQRLLSISYKQSCLNRAKLIKKIASFSTKYNLNEPITTSIKQEFLSNLKSNIGNEKETIKIRNYDAKIKFATQDFTTFGAIMKEIYACMPENTIILSVEVKKEDVLEPNVIYKLSPTRAPDMIFAKLTMRIREIITNKRVTQ
ncbi:hypothetical protein [Candidatus Tisiphia endosymbiont of Nemotelus uliginosus]|uniref:hypothetical protein n=1 Tax=Candidatus Tisiphia endosymbiont of Nemotelus uliginosus TaxID=3077926 RepID=UPI0035C8FC8E